MERTEVGITAELWLTSDDNALFNPDLLRQVDLSECMCTTLYGLSVMNPGENLLVRPLQRDDFDKGYIDVLKQLTRVGDITKERYEAQFDAMKSCSGIHYIVVVEDKADGIIVGSTSLIVERKFVHNAALRGRIEDVVIDKGYRGKHLATLLLDLVTKLSEHLGCYKTSLDCKPALESFYGRFNYKKEDPIYMLQRFYD